MKTQSEIERLAEDTLKSIDHIQAVEANSFLFTRIEARLAVDDYQQGFAAIKYLSRISIALVLFISLNAVTYYFMFDDGDLSTPIIEKTTPVQEIANEFNLNTNQYSY